MPRLDADRVALWRAVQTTGEVVTRLIEDLSVSERIAGASPQLRASVEHDLARLPEFEPRYLRINAEEPVRLKLTIIRKRLELTRDRLAKGGPHQDGRDYATTSELLDDLLEVRAALLANRGELAAHGILDRAIRVASSIGLPLATLDASLKRACAKAGGRVLP